MFRLDLSGSEIEPQKGLNHMSPGFFSQCHQLERGVKPPWEFIQRKSSSVEVDTDSESTTSSEGATRTLLIHGPVELKRGWRRQKQQLFLYSDLLLMSNTNSSEQKEKWRSYLQRYIMLAKEKEQPKSIHLKIFTDDKNSACGSEKDYQLWASSGKEEVPLIGHEHPYGIKMSHIPSTKPLSKEPEDSISPSTTQESLLLEQKIIEMQIQFMLKPRHPAQNKQGRGQKTTKSSAFRNLAFWRHAGTCQNNLCSAAPSAKPRQLFGVSLTHICDNDNLPVPILDFLRNTQGGIFSFDLYDKWLGVINEGTKEEKINAAQRKRKASRTSRILHTYKKEKAIHHFIKQKPIIVWKIQIAENQKSIEEKLLVYMAERAFTLSRYLVAAASTKARSCRSPGG
eukprot:XP_022269151.1 rho GTPase-activating protein 20-like isoform X4 [Canis lupus familiaris]